MEGTPTRTVYAQDANKDTNTVADARENLDEFRAGVEEGDYLAVVYRTPSNAGSLQRVMGTVEEVERFDDGTPHIMRFEVEDGTGDGPTGDVQAEAALFVNKEDAYRFKDGRTTAAMDAEDLPAGGFGVEKWAWTPADETTVEA